MAWRDAVPALFVVEINIICNVSTLTMEASKPNQVNEILPPPRREQLHLQAKGTTEKFVATNGPAALAIQIFVVKAFTVTYQRCKTTTHIVDQHWVLDFIDTDTSFRLRTKNELCFVGMIL